MAEEDKARFADLYNGICFQGKSVISPEMLSDASEVYNEVDAEKTEHTSVGTRVMRGKRQERIRDIKMRLSTGEMLCFLAQENQNLVDYTMPYRCMQYDTMEYGRQLNHLRRKNRESKNWDNWAEEACGIEKADRLIPIYTLCVYHGLGKWDGPRNLRDMMDFGNDEEGVSNLFHDYPMRLCCLNEMEDFQVFHTEIKQVFQIMQFREDKKKLQELLDNDVAYRHMDADTLEVISVMLNAPKIWENREKHMIEDGEREDYDMCKALREWIEEERNAGIETGIETGMETGIKALVETCQELGLTQMDTIARVIRKFAVSQDEGTKWTQK